MRASKLLVLVVLIGLSYEPAAAQLFEAPFLSQIERDPQNSQLYWGLRWPNPGQPADVSVLYRSQDGGVTWQGIRYHSNPAVNRFIRFLRVHPTQTGRAYILASSEAGYLWMTTDGGATWTNPGASFPPDLTPTGLAVAGNMVYVQLGTQLLRSSNGGTTFVGPLNTPCDRTAGPPAQFSSGIHVSPADPDRVVCVSVSRSFQISSNQGETWQSGAPLTGLVAGTWPLVFPHPLDAREYLVHYTANTGRAELHSSDGLLTAPPTTRIPGDGVPLDMSADGGLLLAAATRTREIFRSHDFGQTWEPTPLEQPEDPQTAAFHATRGNEVWINRLVDLSLRRSSNAGSTTEPVSARHIPLLAPLERVEAAVAAGTGYDPVPVLRDVLGSRYSWSGFTAAPSPNLGWLRNLPPLYMDATGLGPGLYIGSANILTSGVTVGTLEVRMVVLAPVPPLLDLVSTRVAGTGQRLTSTAPGELTFPGESGPALLSALNVTVGRTTSDPEGNIYVADPYRVRRIAPDGRITNYAGNGDSGQSGDGGLAVNASFRSIGSILGTPDGLLIVDYVSRNIRHVLPTGIIATYYAPTEGQAPVPDDPNATLALDSQGTLHMAATTGVYRRESNGAWTLLFDYNGLGPGVTGARLRGFAIAPNNDAFILAFDDRVYRRTQSGQVTLLLGTQDTYGFTGDGGTIGGGSLTDHPTAVATDSRGHVFVADHNRIRVILADGRVGTVAGNGGFSPPPPSGAEASNGGYGRILHISRYPNDEFVVFTDPGYIFRLREGLPAISYILPGGVVTITGRPRLAQGSIFSIYGAGMAGSAQSGPAPPLATEIGGVSVEVNGVRVPLFYVSPGLINAQLPFQIPVGLARVRVVRNGIPTAEDTLEIVAAAPDIIEYGDRWGVVVNHDGSINGPSSGATVGQAAVIYFTGGGVVTPPLIEGQAAPLSPPFSVPALPSSLSLTGSGAPVNVPIDFIGHTPTTAGLLQVNFTVPNLPAGTYMMQLTIGGSASNAVKFGIR